MRESMLAKHWNFSVQIQGGYLNPFFVVLRACVAGLVCVLAPFKILDPPLLLGIYTKQVGCGRRKPMIICILPLVFTP